MAQFSVSIYIMQSKQYLASIKICPTKNRLNPLYDICEMNEGTAPKNCTCYKCQWFYQRATLCMDKKGIRLSYREQQFTYDRRIHIYSRNQRSSHPLSTDLWPLDIVLSRPMTTILHHSVFQTIILHKYKLSLYFGQFIAKWFSTRTKESYKTLSFASKF